LSFLGDQATLAVCHSDGQIDIWDAERKTQVEEDVTASVQPARVQSLAYFQGMLAVACDDGKVRLRTAAGGAMRVLAFDSDFAISVAFSADGEYLAAGSDAGRIGLWKTADDQLEPFAVILAHQSSVTAVAFTQAGVRATLASASRDGTIRFWDPETGDYRGSLQGHASAVRSLAFEGDARLLSADQRSIKVWGSLTSSGVDERQAALLDVDRAVD
jgi:WD40 repeat protein